MWTGFGWAADVGHTWSTMAKPTQSTEISRRAQSGGGDAAGGNWAGRRRWMERATLYGLVGSAVIHLLLVLIAGLVTVQYSFGDAGGAGDEGVEFALLDEAALSDQSSPMLTPQRETVETSISDSVLELDLLAEAETQDRSIDDLSESIAPALDPGGGGLTALDAETGSAGAGSGDGASFFGLEAKGRRFAYIVDISGSMNQGYSEGLSRWDQTRRELMRSLRSLDVDAEFHVQLYASGSLSLFGVAAWSQSTPMNKRLSTDALARINPDGGTNPMPAFQSVFALDPRPDAIYYMSDGEVSDPGELAATIRSLNGRRRVPVHCILFGELGNPDAQQRAETMLRNIARQSGGRYTHIGGRP